MAAPTSEGVPCMLMRGGTQKGAYFLPQDLPTDPDERNELLLRIMGSPDPTQIDGLGGASRSTSKAAIVSRSHNPEADVDYLFLQIQPQTAVVTDQQTCGNILAGVAPFAIERGLHPVTGETTEVRIRVLNDGALVVASVQTPNGRVTYSGDAEISGVPFPAASILLRIATDGRPLLPTGNPRDVCAGVEVTCLDAGKDFVLIRALDLDITGNESPADLEANTGLREKLEAIRVAAGRLMGLGDVAQREVPKLTIISPARRGGAISTRTFTPHACHPGLGVLSAISVAAGLRIEGSVADSAILLPAGAAIRMEHPTGYFEVDIEVGRDGDRVVLERVGLLQTARKIFDGRVWPREPSLCMRP